MEENNNVVTNNEPVVNVPQGPNQKPNKAAYILIIILLFALIVALVFYFFYGDSWFKAKEEKVETGKEEKQVSYKLSGNSLEDFDLEFLKAEYNKENIVYSPLSIKYMLAMLNEGTGGTSNKQIKDLIGDYVPTKYENSKNLSIANALFVKNSIKDNIKEEYSNTIKSKYNAELIFDEFSSPANINKWIKDKTFGLIDNGLDRVEDEMFFIVNSLAIDMDWVNQFKFFNVSYPSVSFGWQINAVEPTNFSTINENISAVNVGASFNRSDIIKDHGGEEAFRKEIEQFYTDCYKEELKEEISPEKLQERVNNDINDVKSVYNKSDVSTDFYIYVDDDVKVFAKDLKEYDGTTLQYVGIMPVKDSLETFIKNIDSKTINNYIGKLKYSKLENFEDGVLTQIKGKIPKFKYEYELKLKDDLEAIGITDVFDSEKANLSGITDLSSYINKVIHKSNIEMNEYGIKAAASTLGGGLGGLDVCKYNAKVTPKVIDITFDKPYMYLVRNKKTGEVWFVGSVYTPYLWKDQEKNRVIEEFY